MGDFDDLTNEDRAVPAPFLRLRADDPRWTISPPYNWRPITVQYGGFCWYCATKVKEGSRAYYSPTLKLLAHFSCQAGGKD